MTKESFCWNSFMWFSVLYKRRSFFKERNLRFACWCWYVYRIIFISFSNESYHIYNTTSMLFSLRIFCSWCYLNNTCVGRLILYTNYRLQMKRPNAEVVKIQILFICTSFTITIIVLEKHWNICHRPYAKDFMLHKKDIKAC